MKVISIGNIAMGGTGKTPHTIMLANYFSERGEKVVILSRGYKGKIGLGLNVISDGETIFIEPPLASDEAYMMAMNCPKVAVITGKNRTESLNYAVDNFKSTLAILDDGFQHKALKRDIDILLLDYKRPISTGFPFPFGYLREFPSSISRADIIVFTRADKAEVPEIAYKFVKSKPIFFSNTIFKNFVYNGVKIDANSLKGKKVVAFSAIASNITFYNTLKSLGLDVAYFKQFQDHSKPSKKAIDEIIKHGKEAACEYFITTEKDFVKLSLEDKKIFCYICMDLEINDKENFYLKIEELLKK